MLLATEIVFARDVVGLGVDWPATTGLPDELSITLLRGIQRNVARVVPPMTAEPPHNSGVLGLFDEILHSAETTTQIVLRPDPGRFRPKPAVPEPGRRTLRRC